MTTRRSVLATIAGAGAVSLAGCALLGGETEAEAAPALVSDEALAEAGYQHDETSERKFEETIEVADESHDISLTNWLAEYSRDPGAALDELAGDDLEFARFVVFSTPTVSLAGRDVNPFDRLDEEVLLERLLDKADVAAIEDIQRVGEQDVTVLDEDVEVGEFHGETQQDGIDVTFHLGDLTNEGDFIVFLGAYPALLPESENVFTLAEGIEHPAEVE